MWTYTTVKTHNNETDIPEEDNVRVVPGAPGTGDRKRNGARLSSGYQNIIRWEEFVLIFYSTGRYHGLHQFMMCLKITKRNLRFLT